MIHGPIIRLRSIRKEFSERGGEKLLVLEDLDLDVYPGQFVAIRGESGSGKSTLLRILGLVDHQFSGDFFLAGRRVQSGSWSLPRSEQEELRSKSTGFIFQEDRLFEHLDIRANIELPLRIRGHQRGVFQGRLERLIERVYRPEELESGVLSAHRTTLSGGQRQRASVLRALSAEPLFLLADEPTANLDSELKREIFALLRSLALGGRTIVVVSHDRIFEQADVVYELRERKLHLVSQSHRSQATDTAKVAISRPKIERLPKSHVGSGEADSRASVAVLQDPSEPNGGPSHSNSHPPGTIEDETDEGSLHEVEQKSQDRRGFVSAPKESDPLPRFTWLRPLLPRSSFGLQLSLAMRDLLRNWLFTALAVGAIVAGTFQLTILWSLEAGTQKLLDELIRKGSRLNRITISVKPDLLLAAERLPDRDRIMALPGVRTLVARREGVYRVRDWRGRDRFETIFGLEKDDPELEKLVFTAGAGFSAGTALEVIISERSISRLFEVPEGGVSSQFRQGLIGRPLRFTIARPRVALGVSPRLDSPEMELAPVSLKIVGVVARAELERNFYFPQETQLILERWRLDTSRTFQLPLQSGGEAWNRRQQDLVALTNFSWEERVHIYLKSLDQVIPIFRELVAMGYEARAEIFDYQWVIHTRRLASLLISGLVGLVLLVAGMIIAGNIAVGVRLRLREIVLLKLLGMRDGDVSLIFIWSALLSSALGTLMGYSCGAFVVSRLREFVHTHYQSADFAQLFGPTGPFVWKVFLLGLSLALVFSVVPAYRAGRTDPVEGFGG